MHWWVSIRLRRLDRALVRYGAHGPKLTRRQRRRRRRQPKRDYRDAEERLFDMLRPLARRRFEEDAKARTSGQKDRDDE